MKMFERVQPRVALILGLVIYWATCLMLLPIWISIPGGNDPATEGFATAAAGALALPGHLLHTALAIFAWRKYVILQHARFVLYELAIALVAIGLVPIGNGVGLTVGAPIVTFAVYFLVMPLVKRLTVKQ